MSGYSIFDVIKDTVKGDIKKSDNDLITNRIAVCNICPELKPTFRICGICHCQIDAKSRYKQSTCPLGKW